VSTDTVRTFLLLLKKTMLIDKYLSAYDFNEFHAIKVNAPANDIYNKILSCDVSRSFLTRLLFSLRGIPKRLYTIEDLSKMGFIKLDEQPGKEIVYGIVTTSPTFNCCQSNLSPESFIQNTNASIIKAVINFHIEEENGLASIMSTETRIWCGSTEMRSKFRLYWFFVKPFSQLVRRSILNEIKKQILPLHDPPAL
jgi:hypothetical protein